MTLLEKAREYESEHIKEISEEERPVFHLSPATGWLNDPNGFSFYNGRYHLFYQYNPYGTSWDSMHWGHWTSKDLLKWDVEPVALAPDEDYESGCFSGSAITDVQGKHMLIYTAHNECGKGAGHFREETQCIAFGDGKDYVKYEGNPVITVDALPEGSCKEDFRDPKIWSENGRYYIVTAVRMKDGLGSICLLSSEDGISWKYEKELLHNDGSLGGMWECPDFYRLDGEEILGFSVMHMKTTDPTFRNGHCTMLCIGSDHKVFQPFDLGFDFYAPQSMLTADGRRIVVGWMQAPEYGNTAPEKNKWFGQMSFPRELTYKNNRVYQKPIREIERLYVESIEKRFTAEEETIVPGLSGRTIDLFLELSGEEDFRLKFAAEGDIYTELQYSAGDRHFIIDRSHAGRGASICERREILTGTKDSLKIRLLLDRYSFEIFLNDGEQALSGTLYETPLSADSLLFYGGKQEISVRLNRIM